MNEGELEWDGKRGDVGGNGDAVLELGDGNGGTSPFSFRFGRNIENFDFLFPFPLLPPLPSIDPLSEDLLDPFDVGNGGSTSFGSGATFISTSLFLRRNSENDFFFASVGVAGFELG